MARGMTRGMARAGATTVVKRLWLGEWLWLVPGQWL